MKFILFCHLLPNIFLSVCYEVAVVCVKVSGFYFFIWAELVNFDLFLIADVMKSDIPACKWPNFMLAYEWFKYSMSLLNFFFFDVTCLQ